MISSEQKEIVISHLKALHPKKIGVFGSYARNENSPDSDLDIMVYLDYSQRISLLDLIGVEQDLSRELGVNVDLVTEKSISPLIKPFIEKEVRIIFE
ncbi:MAG TPA: nucleotidyltransferase family protein [Cyclobacteriaceae bacterium]|nr:nucleotidyltransferase family protein [Cyclobacteriaceae bacterium]